MLRFFHVKEYHLELNLNILTKKSISPLQTNHKMHNCYQELKYCTSILYTQRLLKTNFNDIVSYIALLFTMPSMIHQLN